METIRPPLRREPPLGAPGVRGLGLGPGADALVDEPLGVRRLQSAPRHGMLRSWGLLTVAIMLGLVLAIVGYDRPAPVAMADPATPAGTTSAAEPPNAGGDQSGGDVPGTDATTAEGSNAHAAGSVGAVVHVVGQVAQPGVLTLPVGSRVADAVAAAGGALPGSDLSGLNLARRVNDGEQIVVGTAPLPIAPGQPGQSSSAELLPAGQAAGSPAGNAYPHLVNLNRASSDDLEQLPRIGPVTADKIIAHREQNGPFTSVDQLLEVPGIGEGTLAGLRDLVTV